MAQTFEAIIAVLDKASGPMAKIQNRLGGLTVPVGQLNRGFASLGETLGLKRISAAAEGAKQHVGGLVSALGNLAPSLGSLAGVASIGGLIALTKHTAELEAGLSETSIKTGIAVTQLARLHFAASQTGVDTGTLDKGLERLNQTVGDLVSGKNQAAAVMFQRLGINVRDAAGHFLKPIDVFTQFSAAAQRLKDSPILLKQLSDALGARGGAELLPMLTGGPQALKAFGEAFARFHGDVTEKMADDADQTKRAWGNLATAASGLSDAIGNALGPRLTPALTGIANFIAAHRELAANVATATASLGTIALVSSGPVLSALRAMAAPALGLGRLFVSGFALAGGAVVDFVGALRLGFTVMESLALIGIGPIALAVAAAAALAFVAYEVWEHWDQLRALWQGLPEPLKILAGALGAVSVALAAIAAKALLAKTGLGGVAGGAAGALGKAGMWAGLYATAAAGGTAAGHGIFSALGPDFFKAHPELSNAISVVSGHGSLPNDTSPLASSAPLVVPQIPSAGGAPGAAGARGDVTVKFQFENAPPGSRASASARGGGVSVEPPNVGVSMAGAY